MKDAEKRRRVMSRSMRLGHCICDPKKGCPCDTFREHDVCPCAGEQLEIEVDTRRLTDMVDKPGCASKIDQTALKRVLHGLPSFDDPRVLIGAPAGDDAGVYQLDEHTALVQTVDVFTPSVDDPYMFGQIAAANSVSDVYAMGGRPISALSIIGFPIRRVPDEIMRDILRGGIDKMSEAGVPVVGGHSINDPEIKAGFAVTGLVHPKKVVSCAGAKPGDRLILTKPLGLGIIAFARQIDRVEPQWFDAAAQTMAALNRRAAELMTEFNASACTDVTGFGLMGHLTNLAVSSGVDIHLTVDDLPMLPGIPQCLADGILPGAIERNRESSERRMVVQGDVHPALIDLCFDAQTSGGLLISVPEDQAEPFIKRLHEEQCIDACTIGHVLNPGDGNILVTSNGRVQLPEARKKPNANEKSSGCCVGSASSSISASAAVPEQASTCCGRSKGENTPVPDASSACCDGGDAKRADSSSCCGGSDAESDCCGGGESSSPDGGCCGQGSSDGSSGDTGVADTQTRFFDFMQAASEPGSLDAKAKVSISIALSVFSKCEPCLKNYIKKARNIGLTQEEIDEAAWLAVSFGGTPAMMFYKTNARDV